VSDAWNAGITWLDEPLVGPAGGPLSGRTLLVKDLIDTAGIRTTYGSAIYADHVPERNATVVDRVLAAGATVVGKANLPEFAWSVLGQNPWYGTVRNPHRPGRTTCGSSSGNGAALAAGLCDLGIGSDTGGSIRLPSAACGTVGLKPQWGRIPLDGVFPLVPTLDTVGPMATSVADAALLWSVLAGASVPDARLAGLRVGLLRRAPGIGDGRPTERSDAAEQWVPQLEALGATVVEADLPDATADTWPLFQAEALRAHAATFPARRDEYTHGMQVKLAAASRATRDAIEAAVNAVTEWRRYEPEVDLYLAPCTALDWPAEDADELEVRLPLSSFVRWVNLLGWAGLALGELQLVAPRDETVLAAGLALERG
jgi:Asp-tRNA(Asn)/Glu-tRNA(Gln) amidotransferase A subunit family amidase